MDVSFGDMIGSAVLATLLTGFGIFYVFQIALARGRGAGLVAGLGLSLGLLIFAYFPLIRFAFEFLHDTQYYQTVRIVIVVLALVVGLFVWYDYGFARVKRSPSVWTLLRIFVLALLIHLITPLPFNMYDNLISTPKIAMALRALGENIANLDIERHASPLVTWTLPIMSFVIYAIVAFLAGILHQSLVYSDASRRGLRVIFTLVFVVIALYVSFIGLTYEPNLLDKITNLGINRFLQN